MNFKPQDVAETYTLPDAAPSLWWRDLSNELDHYTKYSSQLFEETKQFRKDNIECYFDEGRDTDVYVVQKLSLTLTQRY